MKKGIIFDLDGVLTFTDKFHFQAWKKMADDENIYFDESINNRLRGVSRMDSLEIILERSEREYSALEKEMLAKKKNDIYVTLLDQMGEDDISVDTRNTLTKMKSLGLKLAIGSSSKNTMKILDRTGLLKYFDEIVDGNQIKNSKPDPEVFLKAAEKLGLSPDECIVIEDAKAGIDAGFTGGFETCGIGSDVKGYEKVTHEIDSLEDILSHIGKPIIRLSHIKKVYPNGVCAVKDFSLDIEDGEFVVFVGPSGCGKSTVLRMIAGLEEITDGEFYIDDREMTDSEPKERDIAMVFQNYALYPHLSVRRNIGFPLYMEDIPMNKFFDFKYRKERTDKIDRMVEDIASRIGLSEYLDRKPKNLSGGQRQRVALGRAIIRNPKAFLLDEPLSNLDAKMRAEMRTEISKLHNDLKTAFIYVTHDQVEAMTMGSKIVVMKDGIIQQIGTPSEVFMNPINKFVAGFIGTPQMNFIDATIDGGFVVLNGDRKISIPESILKKIPSSCIGKKICLGVRPKAVRIDPNGSIKGTVSISEQLGDEALVYFTMEGYEGEFISSMQTFKNYKPGESITLSLNLEHVSMFDIETGESIFK